MLRYVGFKVVLPLWRMAKPEALVDKSLIDNNLLRILPMCHSHDGAVGHVLVYDFGLPALLSTIDTGSIGGPERRAEIKS